MMRLACLSLCFKPEFASKQMNDLSFIELCSMLEVDGVDFNLSSLASLQKDHLKKIKKTCLERGLTIACLGVSNDFGRTPAEQQDMLVREGIDTAQFLGVPLVRLFAGNVRSGLKKEDVWKRSVEGLKKGAEYGEKAGVVVGLQNHNHTGICSTGEDMVRLLKDVDHPWCAHILDTGQYLGSLGASGATADDPKKHDVYKSIEMTAPQAVYVRAKIYKIAKGKEEWLDYERIFKTLRGVKFKGFVSLVYEGWKDMDAMHAVPLSVKFLRSVMTS